jgi:hypothetical protein
MPPSTKALLPITRLQKAKKYKSAGIACVF